MPRSKSAPGKGTGKGNERRRSPRKASEKKSETAGKASDWADGSKRGALLLVATPIGNLGDITPRAVEALQGADGIACEDTRVTGKLLRKYAIATRLFPYHEHNAARVRPGLVKRIAAGETIALVSDAGTPLISDPGYKLVRDAIAAALPIGFLPGPSAVLAGLVLSGLPPDRFFFGGFLPGKKEAKRREIAGLADLAATLLFFESPRRLAGTLRVLADTLGEREAAVIREATKLYEEVRRGSLGELAAFYDDAGPPKGEIVLAIGPPDGKAAAGPEADADLRARLTAALDRTSLRDAANAVAKATGRGRGEVYALALELTKGR